MVEIGQIVETNLEGDVGDLLIGCGEQLAGAVDAHMVHKISERIAGCAAEKTREAALAHTEFLSQIGSGQDVTELPRDATQNRVDLIQLRIVIHALDLRSRQQAVFAATG